MSGRGVQLTRRGDNDDEEDEASAWGQEEEEEEEEEGASGSSSGEEPLRRDSSVYGLLFHQCAQQGETSVDVDVLMNYIQKLQLGQKEGEDVYDSSDTASSMSYDLHTLKTMLQCNGSETNRIEEEKYLCVIKKWVDHVRKSKKLAESPQQEVSSVTDSPASVPQDEMDLSYGSYGHNDSRNSDETSHRSSGRHETEETVARLRYEIRCLTDRNNSLLRQYDGSEEALRDYQNRNEVLQTKLDEAMGNLAKLKELEHVNSDLGKMLSETRSMNDDLLHAKERLNREMERIKSDFNHLENTLSTTRMERDQFLEQLKATQVTLSQTKEEEKEIRAELELQLNESKSQMLLMTNDLEDASSFNAELRATIFELEGQLHQLNSEKIFTSTPFRRDNRPLSLLEEIEDQIMEEGQNNTRMSGEEASNAEESQNEEMEEVRHTTHTETQESPELENFKMRVNEKDVKIQSKTSHIIDSISGILSPDVSSSSISTSVVTTTDDQASMKLKLQGTLKEKVKLKKENKNLKKENSDLINRLQQLEAILRDLQGTNGFGPAHIIPEYVDDEVPVSHSDSNRNLSSDSFPSISSSSENVPKTTPTKTSEGDHVPKPAHQEFTSTASPHYSQHSTMRSSVQTSVIYTTAVPGAPIHTSSSTDGLSNQVPPPPPLGVSSEFQTQHTQSPQGHSVVYETNIHVQSQPYLPASTHMQDETTPLQQNVPVVTTASHVDPTFKEASKNKVQTSTQSSTAATSEQVPKHEPDEVTVAATTTSTGGPFVQTSDSPPSLLATSPPIASTHGAAVTCTTSTSRVTPPTSVPLPSHTQATSAHSPAVGVDVTSSFSPISSTAIHTQTTGTETVSHPPPPPPPGSVQPTVRVQPVDTPVTEHQDLAPRSLHFETESPSFVDSLEDMRDQAQVDDHTQVEDHTKPIPSTRRRVTSKDPTHQDDSISVESSDLPLRNVRDDQTSRSTSPGRVFVTSKRDGERVSRPRNIEDFEPALSGQQHKRSRSAEPLQLDKTGDAARQYSLDASKFTDEEEEPGRRVRRSMVLEEPLQKEIVGVVNIRPGVNNETGVPEDSEGVTFVFPETSEEVDSPLELGQSPQVVDKPLTKEIGTVVDFDREVKSQKNSRWPSLSSILLNSLLLLFIIILILAFFVLMIISHDAVERCGSYCPHSPVHFLYATFEPYFQYTKSNTPI